MQIIYPYNCHVEHKDETKSNRNNNEIFWILFVTIRIEIECIGWETLLQITSG